MSRTASDVAEAPLPPPPDAQPSYTSETHQWALVVVVIVAFIGAAIVASPVWIAIVLGTVLAISTYRPFRALCRTLRGRSSLAAVIVTVTAGLLVAFVGSSLLVALTNELVKLVAHLNEHGNSGSFAGILGERLTRMIEHAGVDTTKVFEWAQKQLEAAASFAASAAAVVLRTTSEAILGLIVALLTMYYMLLVGPDLARRIERIAPLEPRHTRALFAEAREVARTAFIGTIATALIQGVLAGIGYALFGVPQPILWGAATAIASFLPVIGTLLVWAPIAGYLLIEGHPVRAILVLGWGVLVVTSLADYVIRPRIVGGHGHGHPLLTLIALLGGIEVFGLAGLVIAPIIMSMFVAAFRLYEREVKAREVPGIVMKKDASASPKEASA